MKVKLVKYHGLKDSAWSRRNMGTVFDVIQQREGGFDVDMGALGHSGEWGFMYDEEVEIVTEEEGEGCSES